MARPKISFYLKSRKQFGGYQLMLRVSMSGIPMAFFTGYVIEAKAWDKKKQRINARYSRSAEINGFLDAWQSGMEGIITKLELSAEPYTLDNIREEFNSIYRPALSKKIKDWRELTGFEDWLRQSGREKQTINSHRHRLSSFKAFLKEGEITADKIHDYVDYMMDEEKKEPSYVKKRLDTVKMFLRYLRENGVEVPDYKLRRKLKVIKKPAVSVRPEEYQAILLHKPSTDRLQKVKDMFIISYNSALRISDSHIGETDIRGGRIVKITEKTDTIVSIPVTDDVREVLERYSYNPPFLSGQKYNKGLKDLFQEAGLDRKVKVISNKGGVRSEEIKALHEVASSKIGRKSFISLMKAAGVPDDYIRKVTGHASAIEMQPYVDVDESKAEEAVRKALGR